jgi:hypothetical protein
MPLEFLGKGEKTVDNKQWVTSQNYLDMIAAGSIPDHFSLHKFGYNGAIGTSEEIIWTAGNGYSYLSAGETLQVSSGSTLDTSAGTGARTVTLEGLDDNYDALSTTVTMNGTASVETVGATFLRIFRAYVATAGSGEVNDGLISIKDNADTVTLAQIAADKGQSQMALWTVPADHELFVTQINASESANKKVRVRLFSCDRSVANQSWRLKEEMVVNLSDTSRRFEVPLKFTEKTDIEMRGEATTTGGDVNAGFQGYYEVSS